MPNQMEIPPGIDDVVLGLFWNVAVPQPPDMLTHPSSHTMNRQKNALQRFSGGILSKAVCISEAKKYDQPKTLFKAKNSIWE